MADPDVSAANILGERGIRYKRNTLAASLIATVLYWTEASLGDVSLFGVSLSNAEDKEATAWTVFFLILIYQWLMLAHYGWGDWLSWRDKISREFKFSVWAAAFWIKEGTVMWDRGLPTNKFVTETKSVPHGLSYDAATQREKDAGRSTHHDVIRNSDRENIRRRLLVFLTIEFGLPFLWGPACLFLALAKINGWLTPGANVFPL